MKKCFCFEGFNPVLYVTQTGTQKLNIINSGSVEPSLREFRGLLLVLEPFLQIKFS